MGLLDDAIREHLELKRRRGADPGEVERQEREALGATQQAGEFAPAEEPEQPVTASEEPEEPDEPVAEAAEPTDAGEEREPFDVEAIEPAPGAEAEPWLEEEQPDEVPVDESLAHPREEPGDESLGHRREEPEEPAEDVLEDTPDFLQETPEHDRLWFEQRPPRDFDWDK
jgi:hypothetical protein